MALLAKACYADTCDPPNYATNKDVPQALCSAADFDTLIM